MKRHTAFALACSLVPLAGGCGKRKPRTVDAPVGTVMSFKPLVPLDLIEIHTAPKNILLIITLAKKTMKADSEFDLEVFGNDPAAPEKPIYSFSSRELLVMHEITGCSADLVRSIESPSSGDVLFCNGSFDPQRATGFTARTPSGILRATGLGPGYSDGDISVFTLSLH